MAADQRYIVDSDVFIAAKNLYYAFEICSGFWDSLIHYHGAGRVYSIDRVKTELLAGRKTEELVLWVKNVVPADFFLDTNGEDVASVYTEVMLWVQRSAQYFDNAKACVYRHVCRAQGLVGTIRHGGSALMPGHHTEAAFESAIEEHLVSSGGYTRGDRDAFDRERCIDAGTYSSFARKEAAS